MSPLLHFALLAILALSFAVWLMLPWPLTLALVVLAGLWLWATRLGTQTRTVALLGLTTLHRRLGSAAVIVIGIAGVAGVIVALLAMAEGYSQTLRATGDDETAIVLRGASPSEVTSALDHSSVELIRQAAGIARDGDGEPLVSPEVVVAASLPLKKGAPDEEGTVVLRGVSQRVWAVRPHVKIAAGRRFQPGLRELLVGQSAARQFANLAPGQQVQLGNQTWLVVGIFASGDALESELWGDATVVADAYNRGSVRNAVTVRLAEPQAITALRDALGLHPQLSVEVSTTAEYFGRQAEPMTNAIRAVGITVGAIMAIGSIFGALNAMYTSVAARARELATLRAVGFSGVPLVVGVLLEAVLLAAAGGATGGLLAGALFNGHSASTLAGGAVGQLAFELRVTPSVLWTGLKWALAIGFIGGLFPAVRAVRAPIAGTLRQP